ncbi:MAG: M23 family metallopeptidase [Deltaproteobacteria bacterium]|nr:M23 family metallopeptidase [Deltaproteobacteria bacterium]
MPRFILLILSQIVIYAAVTFPAAHAMWTPLTTSLEESWHALSTWKDGGVWREGPLPVIFPAIGIVTSGFGGRRDPLWRGRRFHRGIDIANVRATAIHAVQAGIIRAAGRAGGYGLLVEIDHGYGWRTRYAHLARLDVQVGDLVMAGAIIGGMGATGRATGTHLHFELEYLGMPIDPMPFFL